LWFVAVQTRYKERGRKEGSSSLYSLLPETLDTAHAKEVTQLLSEVRGHHNSTTHIYFNSKSNVFV
jgi:hypothetical protein